MHHQRDGVMLSDIFGAILGAQVYTDRGYWCSHRYCCIIVNEFRCDARLITGNFIYHL